MTSAPEPSRPGRTAIVEIARQLVASAELEAVIGFLGPRPLARAAEVSPGTITHHFTNARAVAEAVIDDALAEFLPPEVPAMLLEALRQVGGDHEAMFDLVREAARLDFDHSVGLAAANGAMYLACVVAPNDPAVAAQVRSHYDAFRPEMAEVYAAFADGLGRRFDVEHGFDAESVCTLFTLVTDGFLVLHRFDPPRADRELFVETILRLFDATTVPVTEPAVSVDVRLTANVATETPRLGERADQTVERVIDLAVAIYEADGWERVRLPEIATRLGVRPAAIAGLVGGRGGLADHVWRRTFLPALRAELDAIDGSADATADEAIHVFQHRLVAVTHAHPRLTGAMLAHLVECVARGAGVEGSGAVPLYDVLAAWVDPLDAARFTHATISGALFDRGPTEDVATHLVQRLDAIRAAVQ